MTEVEEHGRALMDRFRAAAHRLASDPALNHCSVSYDADLIATVDRFAALDLGSVCFDLDFSEFEGGRGELAADAVGRLGTIAEATRRLATAGFPGLDVHVVATRRGWLRHPYFHVDTCAFTVIAPLRAAPTLYVPTADVEEEARPAGASDAPLPLGARTRPARTENQAIHASDESALFIMKGAGWRAHHRALVHSPPALLSDVVTAPIASAIIAEISRP